MAAHPPERGYSIWFVSLTALFVTCLIVANILAVKLIDVFGMTLPAGIIIFPLSYIVGDVLTEVYGYRQMRRVIWLGFGCNALLVVALELGRILPSSSFWMGQAAYEQTLGQTPRILLASFLAYLVGGFANSFLLAKMKVATNGRWLWMRTTGSTLVGEGLDSLIFVSVAFIGTMPGYALAASITTQWMAKTLYEVVAMPVTYIVVGFLKTREGVDAYDRSTTFNPLTLMD